jgi:translation initiation factor 5A
VALLRAAWFRTVYTGKAGKPGMAREQTEVREIQEGNYVMISDTPSKITSYSTSKPGKHGSAKARVEGTGVFDNQKRNFTQPVDAKIWVPIITRKQGQVLSVSSGEMQVMDLESYETFTMRVPDDISPAADDEIEFLEYESQRKIV